MKLYLTTKKNILFVYLLSNFKQIKNVAQCEQVWKPTLCFLDMLLFFLQANTVFQALPITKYKTEDRNRLGSEREK